MWTSQEEVRDKLHQEGMSQVGVDDGLRDPVES
jgi:hypothetical protein